MVLKKSPVLNYGHICKNEARECIHRAVCTHSLIKHFLGSHQLPVFCQHFNEHWFVCWFSVWFGFPYFSSPHSAVTYPRGHNTWEPHPQKVRSPLWSQTLNTQGGLIPAPQSFLSTVRKWGRRSPQQLCELETLTALSHPEITARRPAVLVHHRVSTDNSGVLTTEQLQGGFSPQGNDK